MERRSVGYVLRRCANAWWLVVGLACTVGLALYVATTRSDSEKRVAIAEAPPDRQMIESAIAEIAAQSRGGVPEPLIEAAPLPPKDSALREPADTPQPPAGYSFVEFHGEMSKAAIDGRDPERSEGGDDGLEWLRSPNSLDVVAAQAGHAGRDWTFAWIRLAEGARADDLAQALRGTGAEIVGASGRLIRARMPGNEALLRSIAALPEVDGVGATPPSLKLQAVAHHAAELLPNDQIPVFVTLMAGDPDGQWRRALEELGAVVGRYDPAIRVYVANGTYDVLEAIARTDFVMAIEPVGVVEAAHDTAVPAMGADALRMYEGSPGVFSGVGGAPVPIAVMDTGLNINHLDISSSRSSICGANFVYFDPLVDDEDLWVDAGRHGTHVTGTIVGNGTVEPRYAGMAPMVEHIRFAKVLSHRGSGNFISILRGMDFLAEPTACPEAGWSSEPVKPLIVNMSLSATARVWEGRDVTERKLDSIVWDRRQLYVVAQSNADIHGFSNFGAAKNSLAVGAALDSGSLAVFSSHGPTADGRLAPQVVGTGVDLYSAAGNGSRGGYNSFSGTSMASPAVAGVAALLMDAAPAHRERPALARARLMASAIKPDAWMEDADVYPTDNSTGPGKLQMQYGLGKVSARTSVLNKDQPGGWRSASTISELEDGEYAWVDIDVPDGASRLDLVLTWDEPPTDTIASAVLNDLDLWLDHGGDCATEPCGEYESTSRVDNVEWIIVPNPAPGMYRAKVAATRVYTDPPRAALAWTTIRGASTPNLEITVDKELVEVEDRYEERELTVSLTTDEYVAAGTRLHVDCRSVDGTPCPPWWRVRFSAEREDGIAQQVEARIGESIAVGELAAGETWKAKIAFGNPRGGIHGARRLYFKASAWNAKAAWVSVLTRTTGADESEVPEALAPANDGFVSAASIDGEEGSVELDLIRAQTESGEPVFTPRLGRPAGSAWYEWTAPSDDMVDFSVTPDANTGYADTVRVDVFRGDRIAALAPIASADWGVQFFAESGQVYRIRLSHAGRAVPLVLNWSMGPRPFNDDFAAAAVIEDATGGVDGTNAGATLEPGEFFGDLASTVWYRWTAPSDGAWEFESSAEDLRVLAFVGERLRDLRLVSGFAGDRAVFPAQGGDVYRIAVASRDAEATGQTYELTWGAVDDRAPGNDDLAGAEEIPGEASSSHGVGIDREATVEPDEPVESGIRTKWWAWTAPSDGTFAWRIEELTRPTPRVGSRLMVSVFAGDDLNDLQLVATNGVEMAIEFVFYAVGGQRYWISVGLPAEDQWAFTSFWYAQADVTLVWGPTPDNDEVAGAAAIAGVSGSVSGTNRFATGARGERSDILGRSTLWWTYEAPASGWVRFAVEGDGGPWALTVHPDSADGLGLDVVGASRWQRSEGEVLFEAREGVRYMIALGVSGGISGGEFTLRWEEADDPGWLRYAGRLADGDRDSRGNPVEIRDPGDLAVHASGTALYLASGIGLQVFERNEVTGELDHVQLLETDLDLARGSLLFDPHRDRLLADDCGTWRSFDQVGDGPELDDGGELAAADDPGTCAQDLLIDAEGSNIYRIGRRIEHFTLEDGGELRFVEGIDTSVVGAVLSNDGEHLYASRDDLLLVFERDAESGVLTQTDFDATISAPGTGPVPLAITDDDAYLFVFDNSGERVNLFSLEDRLNPERLASLSQFWNNTSYQSTRCRFADARNGAVAVDAFCPGLAFTAQWDPDAESLEGTDWIGLGQSDRFNGLPLPDFDAPESFAVSPDDRHVYLSTPSHGIVILARGAPPADDQSAGPDLVVESPSVDDNSPAPSGAFTLSVVVRNQGDGASAGTTLRYYRSKNTTITTRDTEVGTDAVSGITAGGSSTQSIDLTAPTAPGTYHYGACLDEVADEEITVNNCSTAVAVTVAGNGYTAGPDLVVESPSVDDNSPAPSGAFTLSVVVRNQGDGASAGTTLRYYRSKNTTITTRDTEVGTDAVSGITAGGSSTQSIDLTAPTAPGTYHYGACLDEVADEEITVNNCSTAVAVTVAGNGDAGEPDLVVESLSVDDNGLAPSGAFTLSVVVRNQGDGASAGTTLRYYRSKNTTITTRDTEVGTDAVSGITAGGSSTQSIDLTAPTAPGTYHYGACLDEVADEEITVNNCSTAVAVTVADNGYTGEPDLVVESPSVDDNSPAPSGAFTLSVVVRNQGDGASAGTTLRYYRSKNTTITTRDTEVGTDAVSGITAGGSSTQSIDLTAPTAPGTYHYGACLDDVASESDVENNCSEAVAVVVEEAAGAPDLVVRSPAVDEASPGPGGTFTFSATVANDGDAGARPTTLRYYRSSNATISRGDTEVGTDGVAELAAAGTTDESIDLTAPEDAGTYYYGACAEAVDDESNTGNNCSGSVAVTVVADGEEDSYCRADDVLNPGDSCDIYSTNIDFSVNSSGLGCVLAAGITLCQGADIDHQNRSLNGESYRLRATRDGNSWEIEEVDPAPPD